MATWLDETRPRARKAHRCELCGRIIKRGRRHVATHMVDDGHAYTYRMHTHCEVVTAHWDEYDWESPPDEQEFMELKTEVFKQPMNRPLLLMAMKEERDA